MIQVESFAVISVEASVKIALKLLTRLNIHKDNWLKLTTEFGKLFHGPVGTLQELTDYCEHLENDDGTLRQAVSIFTATDSDLISL